MFKITINLKYEFPELSTLFTMCCQRLTQFSLSECVAVNIHAFLSYFSDIIIYHSLITASKKRMSDSPECSVAKRKHVVLTIMQKGEILQKLDKGVSCVT